MIFLERRNLGTNGNQGYTFVCRFTRLSREGILEHGN
jgi:hypothetical protein